MDGVQGFRGKACNFYEWRATLVVELVRPGSRSSDGGRTLDSEEQEGRTLLWYTLICFSGREGYQFRHDLNYCRHSVQLASCRMPQVCKDFRSVYSSLWKNISSGHVRDLQSVRGKEVMRLFITRVDEIIYYKGGRTSFSGPTMILPLLVLCMFHFGFWFLITKALENLGFITTSCILPESY